MDEKLTAEIGRLGEEMVAGYLRKNGYIVVKRNWQDRFGEIDVIAENQTHIIFVEVKTRQSDALVLGREAVDFLKEDRIRKTAENFLRRFYYRLEPRFDVAEVTVYRGEDGKNDYRLHYIKSAF